MQHSNKSRTLPFETRKNIAVIALSGDGHVLMVVDDGASLYVPRVGSSY
jgi:periodic tryptophan protein 2